MKTRKSDDHRKSSIKRGSRGRGRSESLTLLKV